MNPASFFVELKRRSVIRVAGLYLVGAWLLTQVASTVLPTFDVPTWALRGLIVTLALGFVPALIFSYAWLGEKDLALEQLALSAKIPAGVTYGELKMSPKWDPLRNDPRFEEILRSFAPNARESQSQK